MLAATTQVFLQRPRMATVSKRRTVEALRHNMATVARFVCEFAAATASFAD